MRPVSARGMDAKADEFAEAVRALVREEIERLPFEKVAVPSGPEGGSECEGSSEV